VFDLCDDVLEVGMGGVYVLGGDAYGVNLFVGFDIRGS